MPKRTDISRILIIGAGPIVIGQACEFDYSGTQACKALKEEGFEIILINSNPATIMTDPDPAIADVTYIEPIDWRYVEQIIAKEKPDALLPTMGGQTALNTAMKLYQEGVLDKYNVKLIGASPAAIAKAEDRQQFRQAMLNIGLEVPRSGIAHNLDEALAILNDLGFPAVIRPSFTLAGSGGGIAYNREEFIEICESGLELSPTSELLIDECLLGWKEFEMEVMRDRHDNCIIVCGIENFDPMGIHTGDSITVAPIQTLTDKEYQYMRNASLAVLREIGVETGGANVQFAVNPKDGRMVVIEMNPRVSRSSALASKATGFPIAKVAAKLAVGYTLDELRNEITGGQIPCSFEPTIDYVVTKIPRFNFEKFPHANAHLTTQMKSVGEVMAFGATFQQSLQKAMRGLEIGVDGFSELSCDIENIKQNLHTSGPDRLWYLADAFRLNMDSATIHQLTHIDPWFLAQIEELIQCEAMIQSKSSIADLSHDVLFLMKQKGFSDARIGTLLKTEEHVIRNHRLQMGIRPVFKRIDSCAAEFASITPYLYSTYAEECEAAPSQQKKVIVLGSGPNRIGQGIEFDYCCIHAIMALREAGFEAIMINCNPETVSTDYDTANRLYFESLTLEDVLAIIEIESPLGVIIQYGGQTPLKLAKALEEHHIPILGTPSDAIDCAEDRERFQKIIVELGLLQPKNATIHDLSSALPLAEQVGYPLVVRPSYVLGGRAMEIIDNGKELTRYLSQLQITSQSFPILLDHFLDHAIEVDVDAVCDGTDVLIGGIMEHIEQAGVHSGDSACTLPPHHLTYPIQQKLQQQIALLAKALGVCGLINAQFAVKNDEIFILEVNPRASRTIPFVSKATNMPLAKIATRCLLGTPLRAQIALQHFHQHPLSAASDGGNLFVSKAENSSTYAVKAPVFPFNKFPGTDPILGPEMKSTGEVMGIGQQFGIAYAKAQLAAGHTIPRSGKLFMSVRDSDKASAIELAKRFHAVGFNLIATQGTAAAIQHAGVPCEVVNKVTQGRPHIVDLIKNDDIDLIINTTEGKQSTEDSHTIRCSAVQHRVYYTMTMAGAIATFAALQYGEIHPIISLQEHHQLLEHTHEQ